MEKLLTIHSDLSNSALIVGKVNEDLCRLVIVEDVGNAEESHVGFNVSKREFFEIAKVMGWL